MRDEKCLVDEFIDRLTMAEANHADALISFLHMLVHEPLVREAFLRSERPDIGVYAMYNHKVLRASGFNPSRLLCSYVGNSNRIMLLGSGFIKTKEESIQSNGLANSQAEFLATIARMANDRIEAGEVLVVGSELISKY